MDFHGFCYDYETLGSHFDIIGNLGDLGEMCSARFSLVFEFPFCWGILLSRVSFLFAGTKPKKQPTHKETRSLADRGGGIGDFQYCIVITRGQEERIPIMASVVGTNIGLGSFLL